MSDQQSTEPQHPTGPQALAQWPQDARKRSDVIVTQGPWHPVRVHWSASDLARYDTLPSAISPVAMVDVQMGDRRRVVHAVRLIVTTARCFPNALAAEWIRRTDRVGVVGMPLRTDQGAVRAALWPLLQFWTAPPLAASFATRGALNEDLAEPPMDRALREPANDGCAPHVMIWDSVPPSPSMARPVFWGEGGPTVDVLIVHCDPVSVLRAARLLGVQCSHHLGDLATRVHHLDAPARDDAQLAGLWRTFVRPLQWFPADAETALSVLAYMVVLQQMISRRRPRLDGDRVRHLTDPRVPRILNALPSIAQSRALWWRVREARRWCGLTNVRAHEGVQAGVLRANGQLLEVARSAPPGNYETVAALALRRYPELRAVAIPVTPKSTCVVLLQPRGKLTPWVRALRSALGARESSSPWLFWTRLTVAQIEATLLSSDT